MASLDSISTIAKVPESGKPCCCGGNAVLAAVQGERLHPADSRNHGPNDCETGRRSWNTSNLSLRCEVVNWAIYDSGPSTTMTVSSVKIREYGGFACIVIAGDPNRT